MVEIDKFEKFDWKDWKVGRKFVHVESGEFLTYLGVVISHYVFRSRVTFIGSEGLRLEYSVEIFNDFQSRENAFAEMEEYISIRPFSISVPTSYTP